MANAWLCRHYQEGRQQIPVRCLPEVDGGRGALWYVMRVRLSAPALLGELHEEARPARAGCLDLGLAPGRAHVEARAATSASAE